MVSKITHHRYIISALAIAVGLGGNALAAPDDLRVGQVAQRDYEGATAENEVEKRSIYFTDPLFAQELVQTGYRGSTEIELLDQTRVTLGSNATLRLDEFVYDPATSAGGGVVRFDVGAFRWKTGDIKTKENIRLVTPTATLAIRGTELVIFVAPNGKTEVNVIEGAVSVSACGGGGSADVGAGGSASVAADCLLSVDPIRKLPPRHVPIMPDGFFDEDTAENENTPEVKTGRNGEGDPDRPRGSRGHESDGGDNDGGDSGGSGEGGSNGGGTKGGGTKGGGTNGGGTNGGGSNGGGSNGGSNDGGGTDGGGSGGGNEGGGLGEGGGGGLNGGSKLG